MPQQPEVIKREIGLELLDVRSGPEGRTIDVRAVPYGQTIDIGGGMKERFLHGAFRSFTQASRSVRLFWQHDRRQFPVGKSMSWSEKRDGLYGSLFLSSTSRGEEALRLIQEGIIDGVSVGFEDLKSRRAQDGAVERQKAWLHELSLVDVPAYAEAKVLAVRAADKARREVEEWQSWVNGLRN